MPRFVTTVELSRSPAGLADSDADRLGQLTMQPPDSGGQHPILERSTRVRRAAASRGGDEIPVPVGCTAASAAGKFVAREMAGCMEPVLREQVMDAPRAQLDRAPVYGTGG